MVWDIQTRSLRVLLPKENIYSLGIVHQIIPSLNKNKYIQVEIPHMRSQSCQTYHPPRKLITGSTTPNYEESKEVGPTTPPFLA